MKDEFNQSKKRVDASEYTVYKKGFETPKEYFETEPSSKHKKANPSVYKKLRKMSYLVASVLAAATIISAANPDFLPTEDSCVSEVENIDDYINAGKIIEFGNYDGKPLEWIVLMEKDNKSLVITKDAITDVIYNEDGNPVLWENCTLRNWLNSDFYSAAFSADEKKRIQLTTVPAINKANGSNVGNSTQDYVFLLSTDEKDQMSPLHTKELDWVWKCKFNGADCYWWFRSDITPSYENMIFDENMIFLVYMSDAYHTFKLGYNYLAVEDRDFIATRPAMWIELK